MDANDGRSRSNELGKCSVTESMAKFVDAFAIVESIGSSREISGNVGSHVHVC